MLVHLRIRGLVLIESLDLPFAPGFTALTGETGAGKSLVATAVGLLLGRKAADGVVRRGADEAEVEGLFDISDEPGIRARLVAAGLPSDEELLIRRVLPADGRQRAFVNGRLASLALLAELAEDLASFSGQREHLALLAPSRQLRLLDGYGGHDLKLSAMDAAHARLVAARRKSEDLALREKDRAERLDWLSFQLREIEALDPEPGETDDLARESARLRHQEELLGATAGAAEELYERDGALYERLSRIAREVEAAARHDPGLAAEAERLEEAAALVEEAARSLSDYAGGLSAEPGRIDEVEERRAALDALVRKHGGDLAEVLGKVESMRREIDELSEYEETRERARADLEAARTEAAAAAAALTAARERAAKKLAKAVKSELADLALGDGAFEVRLTPVEDGPGPNGGDRVDFLVALNPGEGSHPLRKVASGGELSRLMLALRRAVAGLGPVGTYVFDEVDAGIGGTTASAVARKLVEVAAHHQVICITHLPQIAGLAKTHLTVRKREDGGRTVTEVRRLDDEERVQEIARMLGGETLTEKTKAAARELLAAGRP